LLLGAYLFPSVYGYNFVGLKDGSTTPDVNLKLGDQITYDSEQGGERILEDISFINGYLWWAI
jgi:hypothetical protein